MRLQSSPLWFSAFSLRLRPSIIVSVIKEFSFPVVPLLQSHCIGEWTQLIACALVTIAVIMEVFYMTGAPHRFHTFSPHVWGFQVSCPPPAALAPSHEPKPGTQDWKENPKGSQATWLWASGHSCGLCHIIKTVICFTTYSRGTWHYGICAVSVRGKGLVVNERLNPWAHKHWGRLSQFLLQWIFHRVRVYFWKSDYV